MRRIPLLLSSALTLALAAGSPIKLSVDATTSPQHHLHAVERIPAAPGALTLFYPKWIPGECRDSASGPPAASSRAAAPVMSRPRSMSR